MLETQALGGALTPGAAADWGHAADGLMQRMIGQERTSSRVDDSRQTGQVLRQAEKFLADIGAAAAGLSQRGA